MKATREIKLLKALILILVLSGVMAGAQFLHASAGNVVDTGTLENSPTEVNFVTWMTDAIGLPCQAPAAAGGNPGQCQVVTEDGFNSALGQDQGYQGGRWYVSVPSNLTSPPYGLAPTNGFSLIHVMFGGLGADSGKLWETSFVYDGLSATTDHGEVVQTVSSGASCPIMDPGSVDSGGKTINWQSNSASEYLIYRSVNGSGAGNGASNGRYHYVASVNGATFTYYDTNATCNDTGTGCWHIVIPADGSGNIAGCHSEEVSPTAIVLNTFNAAPTQQGPGSSFVLPAVVAAIALGAIILVFVYIRRTREDQPAE